MKILPLVTAAAGLAFAAASPAAAHDGSSVPVIAAGNTLLTVTGEGRSDRTPDVAVFSAGVMSNGKTAGEALSGNSVAMNKVIAALRRAGVAERDIQTSNLNLSPVYADRRPGDYSGEMPPIIGYQVSNTVTVRHRKLEALGQLVDALVSAGANNVNGPMFQLDDSDAAMDEARTKAMTAARKRADLYARAAGLRVARIISISESGGYVQPMPVMYARAEMADAPAPPPPPMAAGEVSLSASVTVQFELAP